MVKTEDEKLGPWVYCAQHLRPHPTGWCTVDLHDKLGLGEFPGTVEEQVVAAVAKCKKFGLKIWKGSS